MQLSGCSITGRLTRRRTCSAGSARGRNTCGCEVSWAPCECSAEASGDAPAEREGLLSNSITIRGTQLLPSIYLVSAVPLFWIAIGLIGLAHPAQRAAHARLYFPLGAAGGLVLVVVPAFGLLWSARDVQLGHHRRYRLPRLRERMTAAGFEIVHGTYTDSWLFPLLAGAILLAGRTPEGLADLRDDAAPGNRGLANRLLLAVSRLEAAWTLRWRLPFGVAVLAAGRPSAPAPIRHA